jgi:hypothetical protein
MTRKVAYKFKMDTSIYWYNIPYAVDMEMMDQYTKIGDVKAEHEVEVNFELFDHSNPPTDSRSPVVCVFFYDLAWHEPYRVWPRRLV